MRLSLHGSMEQVPQMSDIAQLVQLGIQAKEDIAEIFKRKGAIFNHYHDTDYTLEEMLENIDDDDRVIDRLIGGAGLTPQEYLNSFPNSNKA